MQLGLLVYHSSAPLNLLNYSTCTGANPVSVVCSGIGLSLRARHGTAPVYLADILRPTSEVVTRRCLRICRHNDAAGAADSAYNQPSATKRFRWLRRERGTVCRHGTASSLLSLRRQTKAHLFRLSYRPTTDTMYNFVPAVHHVMFFYLV